MKKLLSMYLAVVLAVVAPVVCAETQAPDELIKNTAQEVLGIVKQDREIQAGSQRKVLELVDAKVVPHFNFTRMTRLALGKHWRTATPEQQQTLEKEFRNMLVRTYTKAFTAYRDQVVQVKPLKIPADANEVTVRTSIVKPGTPSIPVDYDMEKTADGWKVFDLIIEGVSLVTNYRSTFAQQIQQSGIDGLIKTLAEKNRKAAESGNKAESASTAGAK